MDYYDYGIDSHKLIYHVGRVNDWLSGKNIYPIYIEAAPAGGCNQRCIFCGLDYTGHKNRFITLSCWRAFVAEAARNGVRSILLSGEGEPLLNKDICEFVSVTKKNGMDVAMATNAVLLREDVAQRCLKHLTWMRVSIDAATPEVYSVIHKASERQFDVVIKNIKAAVKIKKSSNYPVTIGIQFLLLKENCKDLKNAALLARHLGVDYFSVKPYSKHPLSLNEAGCEVDYAKLINLKEALAKYNTDRFRVIFRAGAMRRKADEKPYKRCLGLPFWAYISSAGDVYPCSTFLQLRKYCIGNICKESFSDIWNGARRKAVMNRLDRMDATKCRELCRLDEINNYLWKLKNPPMHVNFI